MKKADSISVVVLALCAGFLAAGCEKPITESPAQASIPAEQSSTDKNNPATPEAGTETRSNYSQIYAIGASGNGVVQKALMGDGRQLTGSPGNHDSLLVDTSALPEENSILAIKDALAENSAVIVDGTDSRQSSDKVNRVMLASVGFSVNDAIAYAVRSNKDGSVSVTPLQSLTSESGERRFDQLNGHLSVGTSN